MFKVLFLLPTVLAGFVAISSATVLLPADLTDLVVEARAIAHGRITDVQAQWIDGRRRIDSLVTIEVFSYFKGDWGATVTFRVPGGQLGAYRTVIVGAPVFTAGDEVVLFLSARGPSVPYVLGLSQGLFRIVPDRASGRRLVTPPALLARSDDAEPVVRGDLNRRRVPLAEFGDRIHEILAGRVAPGRAGAAP